MTVKTVEIFVFWVPGTWPNTKPARLYALPLTSNLLKNHPIMKCLRDANFIIVDERTPLPKKRRFQFCTFLVYENPTVRRSGKIPMITSGFCSNLVAKRLRRDMRVHKLFKIWSKTIRKMDEKAIRIISKLLTPGRHLYRVTAEVECGERVRDTLLNFSIDRKCFALCEKILKTKVNVNEEFYNPRFGTHTALTRAVMTGSMKMVQLLLQHEADGSHWSLLSAAADGGYLDITKLFLERGNRVRGRDPRLGDTALHEASDPKVAKLLLACGAGVNDTNNSRETPLHKAVMVCNSKVVRVLLEHNASIEALFKTDFEEYQIAYDTKEWPCPYSSAVAAAACHYNWTIFETLIKFGATSQFENLLHFPSCQADLLQENLEECSERFFDFNFTNFTDSNRCTQLVSERMGWYLDPIDELRPEQEFFSQEEYESLRPIVEKMAVQIIKVEAAYDSHGPAIPTKISDALKLEEFKIQCKNEVELLKRRTVPRTSTPLYDIMTGDPSFVSRFFRDESVASALKKNALYADFPIYRGVLKSRVSRGSWRRQVVNDGIKLCAALFPQFASLPLSIRERIVNLLTNQEILLVEALFSRKQLRRIVGIPNCQILLDEL